MRRITILVVGLILILFFVFPISTAAQYNREVYQAQKSLKELGYYPGTLDGLWGKRTQKAIERFQQNVGLPFTGRLDEQTKTRCDNGRYLNSLLEDIDGITPLTRGHGETRHTQHLYIFRYDESKFNGLSKREFSEMLAAEGIPSFMGYPEPLYKQPLFQEKNFMCYAIPEEVDYTNVQCPVTEKACYTEAVWIFQNAMLGTKEDMDLFAAAIKKIQKAV